MNDTASIVSDLLRKLTELDSKVNEYRHDMAQEFRRYSQQRLQDVPRDVSVKVERLVFEQFQNYPALSPGLDNPFDSLSQFGANTASADEKTWSITQSSPSPSPQDPDTPLDDGTRSPHEREREFHGLFTPSYLPLLDAVQRRSYTSPTPSPQTSESQEPDDSQDSSPAPLINDNLSRPDPVRRGTEDTLSSVTSDDSVSRLRRSALRRSSSSSTTKNQSPRRVRFEVEGEEVLPTSSPPMSPRGPDFPTSPLGNPTTLLDDSYNSIVIDDDSSLLGSSPPMPKKTTSTDRLKAMARNSTEDTSKWEVVGNMEAADDDEEEELVMAGFSGGRANDTFQAATDHVSSGSTAHCINNARLPSQLGAYSNEGEEEENEAAEEAEDADDVLMMPQLSSFKGKKRFSPPLERAPRLESKGPDPQDVAGKRNTQAELSDLTSEPHNDEEDMFEFEDNEGIATGDKGDELGSNKKYIDEEDEDDDDEADATPIAENPVLFSTSPAIPMAKAPVAKPDTPTLASPSPHQMAASAGSYRGKRFSIDVIRGDPELHKKAAEMGDFYTFVGSVDGRSGVDESSSYRPELTYFNGTPRSLSERLMKEDFDETRRNTEINERN
ncbi:hypothetical protein F4820DRAFT_81851 [Hypoxylon rubiginosum]|uniref:Uncharacterized protein n=1 Tax=Hypoxylon rubiginosum TaxID=110542 RepID=A0ACB9YPH3_9PEZI|nr:hypothetical protein F4820DRAFT_81851 [Hypoxylon rubiginosum]